MPSEDAKPVKKEEVAKKAPAGEEEDETKSLSAMLQARKKNPTNAGTLTTKSGSKATKVKKEEPQDDDFDEPIKGKGKGSSGSSSKPAAKVKKEEAGSGDDDDDDDKPIFRKIPASKTDKKVKKEEDNKKTKGYVAVEQVVKRRERKVYDLPGQKRDPPEERDPLRIFYETLYEQIPESEMAQFWLMESGLLPVEMARKVHEKKQKKNKFTSPVKTVSVTKRIQSTTVTKRTPSSAVSSTKTKTTCSKVVSSTKTKVTDSKVASKQPKKRKAGDESSEDDSDEDFLITRKNAKKQKTS
ncbi:nucleolin [Salix suchowensis]|nr:nucleolin [Salix suchowensis]